MARKAIDLVGQEFGLLTVASRAPTRPGPSRHARWQCECECGVTTIVSSGALRSGRTGSCGCQRGGPGVTRPRLPDHLLTYYAAHERVKRLRGPARTHRCVDCGEWARDWSLRNDAVTHLGVNKRGDTCRLSADPMDYEPRCRSCHKKYDRG